MCLKMEAGRSFETSAPIRLCGTVINCATTVGGGVDSGKGYTVFSTNKYIYIYILIYFYLCLYRGYSVFWLISKK